MNSTKTIEAELRTLRVALSDTGAIQAHRRGNRPLEKTNSFGYLVRRQRLALDLTQAALAQQVGCASITIRKIEADERRPSRQMARRLAECLAIQDEEVEGFVAAGLGERPVDQIAVPQEPVEPEAPPPWLQKATRIKSEQAETRFVGREQELAQMSEHLDAALAGEGRVIFVSGEAGQGKTALLGEFARRMQEAHPELIVAQGYCAAAAGMGHAYLPFRDVLVSLSGDLEARWQAGLLSAEQAERLWRFAPTVARAIMSDGPQLVDALVPAQSLQRWQTTGDMPALELQRSQPAYAGSETQQSQLFEQLTTVLQTLAREQPLLLMLDDLQWVDAASASLLFHLGRRLAGSHILIVGAYRPSQVAPEGKGQALATLQEAILEFTRLFGENQIDLQRLDPPTARQLSDALLDREPNDLAEGFRVKLFWQTRGNPLFVTELLREMKAQGHLVQDESGRWVEEITIDWDSLPGRVTAVIEQRLARLGKQARWVLDVASVEGERFTGAVVAAITGLNDTELLRLLSAELEEQHGLVEELGELQVGELRLARFQFSHVLFQHYLYEALGQAQRRQLHGEIADILARLHGVDLTPVLPDLAHHYDVGGRMEEAISFLIKAGDRARLVYALAEATEHYRRAVALLRQKGDDERTARTLMKLGVSYQVAFDYERAQETFDEAFQLWLRATRRTQRAGGQRAAHALASQPLRLLWMNPASLDPTMGGYNLTAPVANQIFSGLVAFGPESEIVPDVAQSWEVTDGGRKYVFHLRDDVFWSDKRPVTAHDFEFTYKRALDPATGAPIAGQLLEAVKGASDFHSGRSGDAGAVGVRALDDHTLIFELREPTSYFIHNLAYYVLLPAPRHVVERFGPAWAMPQHIVTNGPFRLAAWEPGRFMLLQRNDNYHGAFSGNLEQVHLTLAHPPSAQVELYAADRLDVASTWYGTVEEIDELRRQFPDQYEQRTLFATRYYFLDVTQPPFDDRGVRQALAMAVDRTGLVSQCYGEYAIPATGGFVPPGMPGHLPNCALPFDGQQARELLAAAGFSGGDFPPLTVLVLNKAKPVGNFLIESWREHLGIDAELRECSAETWMEDRIKYPLVVMVGGWIADYPDPDNFLRVDVQFDMPEWQDEDYLALLDRAARILDQEKRLGLYQEAERILAKEAVLVPLGYFPEHFMLKPWVTRYPTSGVKNPGFWKDVVMEIG